MSKLNFILICKPCLIPCNRNPCTIWIRATATWTYWSKVNCNLARSPRIISYSQCINSTAISRAILQPTVS